ncbi:MAG TPA: DUF3810 family protein [Vicinamibacterales bacterium]|nr:DUF3810 family protein [Vicinamibacterales bacterium]
MAKPQVTPSEPVTFWLVAPLAAAGLALVPIPGWVVEQFYSRGVYVQIQRWLTAGSNLVPFALVDLFIVFAVYLALKRFVRLLSVARHESIVDAAWEGIRRVARAAAMLTIVFMCFWGLNYRRLTIEFTLRSDAGATPLTPEFLQGGISDANALATRLRIGSSTADVLSFEGVSKALRDPMNEALAQLNREPLRTAGRPKYSLLLTPFFTWSGVDGMLNPLALETIVQPDLLPFERPYVLAHEWAHLSGEADEAEASAVGWYACMHGPAPLAYSASLYLIMEARAALPADRAQFVTSQLDPGVRSDLEAIADRLRNRRPEIQMAANRVYDSYLRANRVSDGMESYGRAVSLILTPPFRDALSKYQFRRR